jgi:uncharacterized protein (TIGR02391 family)
MKALQERGRAMLAARPLKEGQEDVWSEACLELIRAVFGADSNHQSTFIGAIRMEFSDGSSRGYDQYKERRDAESIDRRCTVLQSLIDQLEIEIGFVAPASAAQRADDFWSELHPAIVRTAKPRYDAQHFADSVEAALKEVNSLIKDHVKRKTGKELDGASLMQTAFSPNAPIIVLDDLSTESGRNVQQGYMQIYAGAMIGIRNPKAHANITIDAKRAKHHLHLASLLAYCFDERL